MESKASCEVLDIANSMTDMYAIQLRLNICFEVHTPSNKQKFKEFVKILNN